MSELTLVVDERKETGTSASNRLRAGGYVPAVVYGGGKEPMPIKVDRKQIIELLRSSGTENAIFLLKLGDTGKSRHTMVRELSVDPITREILHIDFQRIVMSEKVRVQVSVELEGTPSGVKNEGGVLDFSTREVEVECLPGDIPPRLTIDVSELHVGQNVEVGMLELPEGVELLEDKERVIAAVLHSRVAAAVEEAEEAAEEVLLEAEEEEPEVIGRGPEKEEEGDEGEAADKEQ